MADQAAGDAGVLPRAGEWGRVGVFARWAAPPIVVMLAALGLSVYARFGYGYPWCANGNDELFWATIISSRFESYYYPISGAAFVWLAQALVSLSGWQAADVIAYIGLLSIAPIVLLTYSVYRRWDAQRAGLILLVLSTTAYFWTPLVESKPQQWGQVIALLGAWLFLACLRGRVNWAWLMLCAGVLALVHILSFAVLTALCAWIWLVFLLRGRTRLREGGMSALAFAPGALFVAWPGGPYGLSIAAVLQDHIQNPYGVFGVILCILGLLLLALLVFRHQLRQSLLGQRDPLRRLCAAVNGPVMLAALLVISVCLIFQALLLPPDYWQMYGNSPLRFMLAQSGNLLFLALTLVGVWLASRQLVAGNLHHSLDDALVMVVGCAVMGLMGLGVTVSMLDNNWFLRIASYTVLFAAPLAALGAERVMELKVKGAPGAARLLIGAAAMLSALLAVRWPGLVSCPI